MRTAFVTLATTDYFIGAKKLFESLKKYTNSDDLECFLFTDNPNAIDYFGRLFDEIIMLPEISLDIKSSKTIPRYQITLHKMYVLSFLESTQFDRVVFLDSDLMCLSSLDTLLNPKLNSYQFLATPDHACMFYYGESIERLGLDPDKMFNTGCFIMNRSILDSLSYSKLVSEISNSDHSYDGSDQGYLNYVVQKLNISYGKLPLYCNYPLDVYYPLMLKPPALVHFTGAKPWNDFGDAPFWDKKIYQYYDSEIFGGVPKSPKARIQRIRIFLDWNLRNTQVLIYRFLYKIKKTIR